MGGINYQSCRSIISTCGANDLFFTGGVAGGCAILLEISPVSPGSITKRDDVIIGEDAQ